jgi:hypothetical protein
MRAPKQLKRLNVRGGSRDPNRGTWCTPLAVANAIGSFNVDPFSNPRSHIDAAHACSLENGDDGFGNGSPGSYFRRAHGHDIATENTRVFLQPPYDIVDRVLSHYSHTRFCALLRFDPRTTWFRRLWKHTALCCVFWNIQFEPPPGVATSSNSFPHALFYANAADVTDEALRMTIAWRTNRHG